MKDIVSLKEFETVLDEIADYIVHKGISNCSENNYIFDYDDISHLISYSDYTRYLPLIADYLSFREEVLDIDISTGEIDVIYGLKYCKHYEDSLAEQKSMDIGKWHVELLDKNDSYGNIRIRDGEYLDRPVWEYEKPGVAFYDTSQDPGKFPGGQFTYNYFVDTLRGTDSFGSRADNGLRMDFDIPAWTVQKEEMQEILHWLDKVVEARTLEALCTGRKELCVKLDNGNYFHIQTCEDGWDYTLYNADYSEIDGGQLDEPDYTIAEAVKEILDDFHCSADNLTPLFTDEFFMQVEKSEQKTMAAFHHKLQIADDKRQQQNHTLHTRNTKDIPERT